MLAFPLAASTSFCGPAPLTGLLSARPAVNYVPKMVLFLEEPSSAPPPLARFRRVLELQHRRRQRQQEAAVPASPPTMITTATSSAVDVERVDAETVDAETKLLQRLLPVMLVLLLTVGNLAQIAHVLQQLQFVDVTQRELGNQLGFDLVSDVLAGGEFNGGLSNVVGQAVAEALGGPLLLQGAELFLNAALAKAFGRRLVPLLIVGEAFIDTACELAGQPVGDRLGEALQPTSEALLATVAELGDGVCDGAVPLSLFEGWGWSFMHDCMAVAFAVSGST